MYSVWVSTRLEGLKTTRMCPSEVNKDDERIQGYDYLPSEEWMRISVGFFLTKRRGNRELHCYIQVPHEGCHRERC